MKTKMITEKADLALIAVNALNAITTITTREQLVSSRLAVRPTSTLES